MHIPVLLQAGVGIREDGPVRLRLDLGYDGTDFSGWAAQPGRRTVEGVLSDALTTLLRAPEPVRLTVAGRTDAGGHARGQVAHADGDDTAYLAVPGRSDRSPEQAAITRLAGILPPDVVVHRVCRAPHGFDARFSATSRRYRYRIADAGAVHDPLRRRDTVWLRDTLDVAAMDAAAGQLLGLGDFAAFCKRREGATTVRTLLAFTWTRHRATGVVEATVVADAFCHSMVRALVGAVVPVGLGRRGPEWPRQVERAATPDPRSQVVPGQGPVLGAIRHPPEPGLAGRAPGGLGRRAALRGAGAPPTGD